MHKLLEKLDETVRNELLTLSKSVTFKPAISHRRRMGMSGKDKLSIYNNSKYLKWTSEQRSIFKTCIGDKLANKALVSWFVQFPAETGFLDKLNTWVNSPSPAWLYCYLVEGKGKVGLNEQVIELEAGQGIAYSLANIHSVETTQEGSLWACVMIQGEVM